MSIIVGLDEVGRGAWAGPLVAAAVILKRPVVGLKDSKLIPKARRPALARQVRRNAHAVGLGWVWPRQIDKLGLTQAIAIAMQEALNQITFAYDQIIIDGSYNFLAANPKSSTMVKADLLVPAVSAASVIAKVARDQYMLKIAKDYPKYLFERHVGYGTRAHRLALNTYGTCDLHRASFAPLRQLSNIGY